MHVANGDLSVLVEGDGLFSIVVATAGDDLLLSKMRSGVLVLWC